MAIMKQMEECLERAFKDKMPTPSRKWKAFWVNHPQHEKLLYLYHYQHLVLVYDNKNHTFLYEWWEKPADKRGLDSAKEWLNKRKKIEKARALSVPTGLVIRN